MGCIITPCSLLSINTINIVAEASTIRLWDIAAQEVSRRIGADRRPPAQWGRACGWIHAWDGCEAAGDVAMCPLCCLALVAP